MVIVFLIYSRIRYPLSHAEVKATHIEIRLTAKPLPADEHVVTYMNNQKQTEGWE